MGDQKRSDPVFATVAMAEILIAQNLVDHARRVVEKLSKSDPKNHRLPALSARIDELARRAAQDQTPADPTGADRVDLQLTESAVRVEWELTESGLDIAKRRVRFSGVPIVRLFTAAPGPRGVRTTTRDLEAQRLCARYDLFGLPRPAVLVASVGFLAHTGEYVPLARSRTLGVQAR